jgi:hypothetical protein
MHVQWLTVQVLCDLKAEPSSENFFSDIKKAYGNPIGIRSVRNSEAWDAESFMVVLPLAYLICNAYGFYTPWSFIQKKKESFNF